MDKGDLAFKLSLYGGNIKDLAHDALAAAKRGEYNKADSLLTDARREYEEGDKLQEEIVRDEDEAGEETTVDLLLAHGLDQLMTAESEMELIEELISLHKRVDELEESG
jgi:PTS system cellobiose-specific IIA component